MGKPISLKHICKIKIEGRGTDFFLQRFNSCNRFLPVELKVCHLMKRIISSTEALQLQEVPNHLVVVGGGYIGLELGTAYAKFGAKVTILEDRDTILSGTDLS